MASTPRAALQFGMGADYNHPTMWVVLIVIFVVSTVNYEREREAAQTPPSSLVPSLERPAPELADDRKVNEQDCTKPVDVSSGNLRCK